MLVGVSKLEKKSPDSFSKHCTIQRELRRVALVGMQGARHEGESGVISFSL